MDAHRVLFLDKQYQLLDVAKKAMAYLKILNAAKEALGVSTHEEIPEAIHQLKKCGLFHGLIGIINEQQELISLLIDERPKTEKTKEIKAAMERIIGKTETVRNQASFALKSLAN